MKTVFLFPGQNSRYPEMIERLRRYDDCDVILRDASNVLGRDLGAHYRPNNSGIFARNRDIQIGVFLTNHIYARLLEAEGITADASLGLSLGEYNHLVEIGALSFEDALHLLEARGAAYEQGPSGMMISVFPCDQEQVDQAIEATAVPGRTNIGLQLSARHFVLSGTAGAVQTTAVWLEEEAYAQTRVIDPNLPMHAGIFQPVADTFRASLQKTSWRRPEQQYLPNVSGSPIGNAAPADFEDSLYRHVFNTVHWAQSLEYITQQLPEAAFIEAGPGNVLYNSFRREFKQVKCFRSDDPEHGTSILESTIDDIRRRPDAA